MGSEYLPWILALIGYIGHICKKLGLEEEQSLTPVSLVKYLGGHKYRTLWALVSTILLLFVFQEAGQLNIASGISAGFAGNSIADSILKARTPK